MAYVITQNCCNEASCVPVCPVNCIHPTPDEPGYATSEMLYIDPDVCIDCGACMDVCPVKAIEPDFDLSPRALPFIELNAQFFRHPDNQGYPQTPKKVDRSVREWPNSGPLRVAVVGSGPAACYVVEELLGHRGLDVRIDVFERLSVPWGLARFGVAPDHQATKGVVDDFTRTMRNPKVRMFLDVEVGGEISHEDLTSRYHAVVYAVGAMGDKHLDIPGEGLRGVHSATEFVAWYNGHPDFVDREFDLSGERAVIIGNGNVALDVARILLSDVDNLRRTDIADHALDQLANSNIREVSVVGRRGPGQAAFTTPELLGLSQCEDFDLAVEPSETVLDDATQQWAANQEESIALYKARLISELGAGPQTRAKRASLRFGLSPVAIYGEDTVEGVRLVHNTLAFENGVVVARPSERVEELSAGLVLRSVGYRGLRMSGVPFDDRRGVLPNVDGRVVDPGTGSPEVGVYAAGWIKRGPSGVIGTNKRCAAQTTTALVEDWTAGRLLAVAKDDDIASLVPDHLDFADWNLVDRHERALGRASSRPRVKLVTRADMRAVARTS